MHCNYSSQVKSFRIELEQKVHLATTLVTQWFKVGICDLLMCELRAMDTDLYTAFIYYEAMVRNLPRMCDRY